MSTQQDTNMSKNTRVSDVLFTLLVLLSPVITQVHTAVIGGSKMDLGLDLLDEVDEESRAGAIASAAELGAQYSPASLLNMAGTNPLRDQPNLSSSRLPISSQMIYGSRKAFTVTKVDYLKKEWCKTEPLKQVIREEGCLQRTVINRFCYGQCNSFFIPKSNKKDLEAAAFKSCSFCKPKRYSWITVTLRCPRRTPRFKRKRIQIIKRCKCMAQKLD